VGLYQKVERLSDPGTFFRQSLAELNISLVFNPRDKFKIPSKGPCVVISNHPFGALEGIILAEMLLGIRSDIKIMGNFLLARIPQLRGLMISVDPFEGKNSAIRNGRRKPRIWRHGTNRDKN
jgi:putative hemolysin